MSHTPSLIPHLVHQGRLEQIGTWLEQLPEALIAASPPLVAASVSMQGLRKQAPEYMEPLLEHMEQYIQVQPREAPSWGELHGELALRHALMAFSKRDFAHTIILLAEALRSFPVQRTALNRFIELRLGVLLSMAYRASGDLANAEQVLLDKCMPGSMAPCDPLNLGASWSLARLYAAQGRLREQAQLYEQVFQMLKPDTATPPLILTLVHASQAALWYEWNRLPEAAHAAQQALLLAEQMGKAIFSVFSSSCLWTQACIDLAQGHTETARDLLTQGTPSQVQMPLVEREEAPWAAIHARPALACDQMNEAWQWATTSGKRFDDQPGPDLSGADYFEYMTLARILIARGRRERSRSALSQVVLLLDYLRNLVIEVGLHGWFLEIQMLTALALQTQGRIKQALVTLGAVLAQAEPEGYVRLFADESQPMAHLLAQVGVCTTASPVYIQQLQNANAVTQPVLAGGTQSEPYQPLHNPLSEREHEVLVLLAEGATNQQIADRLVISLNTAKLHVKHLLVKLSVTNRTQAVVRARALHLF